MDSFKQNLLNSVLGMSTTDATDSAVSVILDAKSAEVRAATVAKVNSMEGLSQEDKDYIYKGTYTS